MQKLFAHFANRSCTCIRRLHIAKIASARAKIACLWKIDKKKRHQLFVCRQRTDVAVRSYDFFEERRARAMRCVSVVNKTSIAM